MKSNKRLLSWFRKYNRKFWGGKLKEPFIRWEKLKSYREPAPLGQYRKPTKQIYLVTGKKWKLIEGRPIIALSRTLRFRNRQGQARMTLLHEMAHAALPIRIKHGPRFQKEMLRIAKLGAFEGLW